MITVSEHNITRIGNNITLPDWLDDYIFNQLHARYRKKNRDLVVLNWDRDDILSYLGTYFPRTFAESYCVFSDYFHQNQHSFNDRIAISIFDFGCGTGGELVGLICAIQRELPHVSEVNIKALDGNQHALEILELLLSQVSHHLNIDLDYKLSPIVIDDFYDLSIVRNVINRKYDIFITFKAICEFVTLQQFESRNPYSHIISTFKDVLNQDAIMCIADVTTYSDVSNDWLPKMMDRGVKECGLDLVYQNEGYNETFLVSHSGKHNDVSKIAWRILINN